MEIRTERLTLKPHDICYLATTHRYASDMENTKYMTCLPCESVEETSAFLQSCAEEWEKPAPGFYELTILKNGGAHRRGFPFVYVVEKAMSRYDGNNRAIAQRIGKRVFACLSN